MATTDTYRLVRLRPNGQETILAEFTVADMSEAGLTQEQVIREAALQASRQNRTNNPAWRLLLYGPTNGGPYTADDIIWDSAVNL